MVSQLQPSQQSHVIGIVFGWDRSQAPSLRLFFQLGMFDLARSKDQSVDLLQYHCSGGIADKDSERWGGL